MIMRRIGFIALVALTLSACDNGEEVAKTAENLIRPAKIAIASEQAENHFKNFPGVTEATRRSTLAFRVNGQVMELPVLAGQILAKGDLIAKLDNATYLNTLADRKAKYDLAKTEFDRQRILFNQKHVAKSRLDSARSDFEAAEAAYKLAKDDVTYTELRAPYDGMVSRIDIDNFQNVQAKEAVVQFQGAKEIDVVFNIPENLFVKLNKDNTNDGLVQVRFDALPDRVFDAFYREHETVPDTTTRSFKVTVSMPRPEGLTVLPGMSVSVRLDLSQVYSSDTPGVLLPLEAVFDEGGKKWVWKLDENNAARKTEVQTKGIEGSSIRITGGVKNGEHVIAIGVSYVHEGQKVRPLVKERGL